MHVSEGGQAVVADEFHHHEGGQRNAKASEQSHATGTVCDSATMLGKDTAGNGMPITSREGEATMQNARGD